MKTVFSVIIPTQNREVLLDKCLYSISRQKNYINNFEILVIDNNSNDRTKQIVRNYMLKNKHILYFFEENIGLNYARNKGCHKSKSEYLVYIDDDVLLPALYFKNLTLVIDKFRPDLIGGPVYPYFVHKKPFWFKDKYVTKKYENRSGFSQKCSITGANYIIRKSILLRLGLFDTKLGNKGKKIGVGEERLILDAYRSRTPVEKQKVYYSLDLKVRHLIADYKMSLIYMVKRSFIAGNTKGKLSGKKQSTYINICSAFFWIIITPIVILIILIREYMNKGKSKNDLINIILNHSSKIGYVTGIIR